MATKEQRQPETRNDTTSQETQETNGQEEIILEDLEVNLTEENIDFFLNEYKEEILLNEELQAELTINLSDETIDKLSDEISEKINTELSLETLEVDFKTDNFDMSPLLEDIQSLIDITNMIYHYLYYGLAVILPLILVIVIFWWFFKQFLR